ncbi:MAG: type VI secretion system contractile sheath large subunit [Proteobacteria bacterium]|nr:type VI secretion system contractile sheath large subunit [Pseudomonadota bacterium]
MDIPNIPFTILALSPLAPLPESGYTPRVTTVDLATVDETLEAMGPRLYLPVPKALCPDGALTIEIKSIKDFRPDRIIANNEYLRRLSEAGRFVDQAQSDGLSGTDLAARLKSGWPDLPLDLAAAATAKPAQPSKAAVDDILAMVAMPDSGGRASTPGASRSIRGQIDSLLSGLLEHVLSDETFRTCEASWRGVEVLLRQGPVKEGGVVRLKIVPVNQAVLSETLDRLTADLLADLPNLVLIDLPFDASAVSTDLLEKVAGFAETLLVPTACWVTARLFHIESWAELKKVAYLKHHLEDAAYAKWRKIAQLPGANWLTVTCNRFMCRAPYGPDNRPKTVSLEEQTPLWVSPVWALGALAAQSTVTFGWPSRFTDYANVALRDLPLGRAGGEGPSAAEMLVPEDRLVEFLDAGLTPLLGPLRKDLAFMPKETTLAGGSLKYQLFVSGVLGFLFWCKDHLGEAIGRDDVAKNLKTAFILHWEKTGRAAPEDLDVRAGEPGPDGAVPLSISLTPPVSILPGAQKLEFSFNW